MRISYQAYYDIARHARDARSGRAGEASDATTVVWYLSTEHGTEVTKHMMTIDLPTVDELHVDVDGGNDDDSDGATETA